MLLNCDEGLSNPHRPTGEEVAEILRISQREIDRVKRQFVPWRQIGWVIPPQGNAEFVAAVEHVLAGRLPL